MKSELFSKEKGKVNKQLSEPVCYIVGAMPMTESFSPQINDLVIAADAGLLNLESLHIIPDIIIGDFDSLGHVPTKPQTIRYPKEKNDTDMMLAIKTGLKSNYKQFVLYGGIGGRLDHTLANIQALAYLANRDAQGYLIGQGTVMTAIRNSTLTFNQKMAGTLSVFSLDKTAEGVSLRGLKYPLRDATLKNDWALGVSNEFTEKTATITVKNGTLLILWYSDTFDVSTVVNTPF